MDKSTTDDLLMAACVAEDEGRYDDAFVLFQQLANLGHPDAMSALARFYDDGLAGEADFDLGLYWAEKAIAAGSLTAINNLAVTYRRIGQMRKSKALFERALAAGDMSAALDLAHIYSISDQETDRVKHYLQIVLDGEVYVTVSEGDIEEARALLAEIEGVI